MKSPVMTGNQMGLEESTIEEKRMNSSSSSDRPKVLIAANSTWNLLNFRAPIIAKLKTSGFAISIAVPDDEAADVLRDMGLDVHQVPVDARGLSPVRDARLLFSYQQLLRRVRPAAFLTFTPKPNIYGSMAAALAGVPVINTITGLGTGFLSGRALQGLVSILYRASLRRSHRVFFHNPDDQDLFIARKLVKPTQAVVVPGSGIDLDYFAPTRKPRRNRAPIFLFIGRLLKDKGALEFAEAASIVQRTKSARFQMLGSIEDHPKAVSRETLDQFVANNSIELLGATDDVRPFIAQADCVVLPSYREGLPRVLLEAAAMATPVVATDVPGCRHVVDHGVTGLLCKARSSASLAQAMAVIADMLPHERAAMGARGRLKAEREYSQECVVTHYLNALRELGI